MPKSLGDASQIEPAETMCYAWWNSDICAGQEMYLMISFKATTQPATVFGCFAPKPGNISALKEVKIIPLRTIGR